MRVKQLVSRLELEKYKATDKGLTVFGDRREGTQRNRDAVQWITEQLKSYGCSDVTVITYEKAPQANRGGGAGAAGDAAAAAGAGAAGAGATGTGATGGGAGGRAGAAGAPGAGRDALVVAVELQLLRALRPAIPAAA